MKVLLALAFLLWLGADARYSPEHDVRYPPEQVERRYSPEYSLRGSPFIVGKTHRYELTINVTAGVPGLTSQVAKSLIQLQVNIRPKTENEYVLKAEYVKVSEPRSSVDSGDAPLPLRAFPELERDLSQPIRFTYENGEVKSYTLGYSESLPSRSIKRAILRHFQMKLEKNPRREEEYHEYYPVTYRTTERDEAGPYEAIYTVNVSPYAEFPYEDKVYNITRVHNYEHYGYPVYYERHNFDEQGFPEVRKPEEYSPYNRYGARYPAGYESYQTPLKASKVVYHNLRYIHGKYVIENVQVEEKSIASLYDQDLVVSIESQYVLKEISDRHFEEPRERQIEYTELYTAPTEEELKREKGEQAREGEDVTEEYQFLYGIFDNVRSSELVAVASRILEKISASVVAGEIESPQAQQVPEDAANLQDVFSLLKKQHLDAVYRRVPDIRSLRRAPEIERVKRQFFLDVLPLAGTDDSVEYIRYLIEERKVSVYEAQQLLQAIPKNLIKATEKNVQDLLALTELPYVRQHHILHSAVYLTVSRVIREAYVVPHVYSFYEDQPGYDTRRREQDFEYPEEYRSYRYDNEVYRHPDEQYLESFRRQQYRYNEESRRYGEVTLRKYIQDIRSKLKSATKLQEKAVYIQALAHLSDKKSLKVLKPYVYGYAADTEEYAPGDVEYLRTVTIYALHYIVHYYPEETQEIVAPVYFTKDEVPRIRMAAFSVLIRSHPSLGLLQQIAQDSYDEPSYEVGSYVYSALQAYGNATTPSMKPIAERIRKIISQVKSYDIGKQYSKYIIKTFFDELRNFGLEKYMFVAQSNESFIPSFFYTALEYNIQALRDAFYRVKLVAQGLTVEDLTKMIDYEMLGFRPPRDIPQGAESEIFKGLNLIPRLPKELRVALYTQIFYNPTYYYVDAQSIGSLIFPIVEYFQDYLTSERGVLSGHFVKTYIPSSYESLTYSSVGFPVDFRMKHPLVVSIKVESRRPPRGPSSAYSFYVRPSVYYGTYHKHSIFNTAAQRAYGVYQEQKYIATYPFELSFYAEDEYTFEVSYKVPEVPKRVYRSQSEAGTYERELKLRYIVDAEEYREPIKAIPALFQREYVVNSFGFPSVYVTYYTEDIQDQYVEVPQDLKDIFELIVDAYRSPGFRRRDVNVTIVSRPSSPVDQVKFTFSYNRTYDARSESQNPGYTSSPDSSVKDFSRSRHMAYSAFRKERGNDDEYSVLSRIFPQRRVAVGEYEEITADQARKVYEAFSEKLSNVAYELRFKVETGPDVKVAELKVEYNHTFDKTLHNVRAEFEAYTDERRTPYKVHLVHVMRYVNSPNAFRYNPRAYVGQYASFFNAITFGERPRTYEQSDVIAQGAFVKVPAEQHFSRNEFPENPGRDVFLPESYEECEKDVREGKSQTPACIAAVEEDARLNKVYVRVTAQQDLPPPVQNLTYKLEEAIKYYYYESAEINGVNVRNTPRTFEMVINYIDKLTEKPVLDVYMKKPSENVIYHKVDFEYLEPLSSVYTLHESYKLRSTNYTYPPFCALMEKYVKTYDKEVYPLPRDGCTYVLSTHCTERKKFAVLAKRTSPTDDYKEVYIFVADQKVLLKPERSSTGVYTIIYNERPVEVKTPVLLDEENLLYAYPVSIYDEEVKYVLVLQAEKAGIKLEYDGKNVKLEVSPVYKGELCGLCSEYDGEITREYRGPNQDLYVDSEDFAHSSIVNADICGVNPEPRNPFLRPSDQYRGQQRRGPYPLYGPYSSYETSRYPYGDESEERRRYPYGDESEERRRYPYGDESEERRRYPYGDESEERPRYPYYSEDERRYPSTDVNEEQEKSRYPYRREENYEPKDRYPYGEEDEVYRKVRSQNRYPYYNDKDESNRRSRYSYDDSSRKYNYPDEDQSEYRRKPYDEKDELNRRYGYPYYEQDESYVKSRYPSYQRDRKFRYPYENKGYYSEDFRDSEETYKKSRYPYEDEEESSSRKPRSVYEEQEESYKKSRYPYGDRYYSSRKPRKTYDEQGESNVKSRYPYGDKYESYKKLRYPYDDEVESYQNSRYPYDDQDEYYQSSRYPYDYQDEYYRGVRYPYEYQDKLYEKVGYRFEDQKESYQKSRYPYDDQDEYYRRSRYPYDYQDEYYRRVRYPYEDQDKVYKKVGYPYEDQNESYQKSRYPYYEQRDSYKKSRYSYDYQDESYPKTRYPYDYQGESYRKYRYQYDDQDESYPKYRYQYGDQDESYPKYGYLYGDKDESYRKGRYGYDEQDYQGSGKPRYAYEEKNESYKKYRNPYDEQDEYSKKSRYPYYEREDSYQKSRYPYSKEQYFSKKSGYSHDNEDDSYKKFRSVYYEDKDYPSRSQYPYYDNVVRKSRYPYGDKYYSEKYYQSYEDRDDSYKIRHPYDEKYYSYRKTRYPYGYEDNSYGDEKYFYGYEGKSYDDERYPYGYEDKSYGERYPYGYEDKSYRGERYPYSSKRYGYEDKSSRDERYPYGYEYKPYGDEKYPYGYEDKTYSEVKFPYYYNDESYKESRYPYGYENKSYGESRYPYGYENKSYGESRYPYGYIDKSYKESRYPYGYEDKSYKESRYPYGYEDKSYKESRYPYGYEGKTYKEYRYPYDYENKSYKESTYPYGYEDKSYKEPRYPYGYEDKSYKESRYPYGYEDKSYKESRYPYGYEDKSYKESRYPYGYEDKSYKESSYPYGYQDKLYKESRYPYGYEDKSFKESRYPYGYEDKSESRYPYSYEEKSYSAERYPYVKDDSYKKSTYSDEKQSYEEPRYPKTESDDLYERRFGYPTTYEDKSYRGKYYTEKDEKQTTSYAKDADVKIQPKERTVYVERNEKICFSTQPVPVCEEGYKPTEEYQKSVDYHCLPKDDVTTKRLIAESKERVLRELSSKKVDYTESYTAGKYCSL